jgi:hypothetical protein
LRIGIEAEHEMRGKMLFENSQTSNPSSFGRVKDARSRGVKQHSLIEMGDAPYMRYWKFARLIQPGLDSSRHRASPQNQFGFQSTNKLDQSRPLICNNPDLSQSKVD